MATGQDEPDDRVIIELRNSDVYEGNILRSSSRSIELSNIFCPATNTLYDGSMTFYHNEIASVLRVSKSPQSDESPSPSITGSGSNDTNNGNTSNSIQRITMDCDEFNRLRQMTYDFIFIDTFSSSFDNAVEVLSNRESIAVVGLGNTFKGKRLSLLVVSDFKQVYIFDMHCLVELKSLKHIFKSSFICKVVYDGLGLNDCLSNKYNVQMNNVFDVKIVDQMITTPKVERNISECLTHYFHFPSSLLAAAMDGIVDGTWGPRPIQKNNKIQAAQLVVYLLSLRDTLMSQILKPYTSAIQNSYLQYKKSTDCELLKFGS